MTQGAKPDIYTRITDRIIEALEAGTRPWLKPWSAEHAAGKITRPLRYNGQPYSGISRTGKPQPRVLAAIVRELAGFVWDIARKTPLNGLTATNRLPVQSARDGGH